MGDIARFWRVTIVAFADEEARCRVYQAMGEDGRLLAQARVSYAEVEGRWDDVARCEGALMGSLHRAACWAEDQMKGDG